MKKNIIFIIIICSINCYSQIQFENGYFINNSGEKTDCLIKNIEWKNNPFNFEYQSSKDSEINNADISSIKEFGIYDKSKYIREKVKVDISRDKIGIDNKRNPVYDEKQLFLKAIIEGRANLYSYNKMFFFNVDSSEIEQLIYKEYLTSDNKIAKNVLYKNQLLNALKCNSINKNQILNLYFSKKSLINIFTKYNQCQGAEFTNLDKKPKKVYFYITLRPRINNSNFSVKNEEPYTFSKDVDFGNILNLGLGFEMEFILPYNRNKWSIIVEPTFLYFTSQRDVVISHVNMVAETKNRSLELPVGIRHYFFINQNSKLFINASSILDINLASTLDYKYDQDNNFKHLDFSPWHLNFAFGGGFNYKSKYCIEFRYQTNRNVFIQKAYWSSDYKAISLVFGYTFFNKKNN